MTRSNMPGDGCERFRGLPPQCAERVRLEALREAVKPVLSTDVMLHYTDHSVAHSDRVVAFIDELVAPAFSDGHPLTREEVVPLYSSCYLHDLGMHVERVADFDCLVKPLCGRTWEQLPPDERLGILRDYHHRISAEMISTAVDHVGPCPDLPIGDLFPGNVAALCAAHNLRIDSSEEFAEYAELTMHCGGRRMDLLAALLRVADILDESHRRACRTREKLLELSEEAKTHWWRHFYTEHVELDPQKRVITLEFQFPPEKRSDYEEVIPALQLPAIKAELRRHEGVLTANGMMWTLSPPRILDPPYNKQEPMAGSVFLAMASELQRRKAREKEAERMASLSFLRHSRKEIKDQRKRLEEQKDTLAPEAYLEDVWALCEKLKHLGGIRDSWAQFQGAYHSVSERLSSIRKVDFAVRLAQRQLRDDSAFLAVSSLTRVAPLVSPLDDAEPLKFAFYRTQFHALYDLGIHFRDAQEAGRRAFKFAPDDASRAEIADAMVEMAFLVAEPEDALSLLGNEGLYGQLASHAFSPHAQRLRWRLRAMRGESEEVLQEIGVPEDNVASGYSEECQDLLLVAEILHLSGKHDEAHAVFSKHLGPILESQDLPTEDSATLASCYQSISLSRGGKEPLIGFYESVDDRRLSAAMWEDEHHALLGIDAAEADKHFDAMGHLLLALRRAFRRSSWGAFRTAATRLARECVRATCFCDAAFYAVLAREEKLTSHVCHAIAVSASHEDLVKITSRLLRFSGLPVHCKTACDMFRELSDELPEEHVAGVVDFLVAATSVETGSKFSEWEVSRAAWKAISVIIERCPLASADGIAQSIFQKLEWRRPTVERVERIKVLRAVARKLPAAELATWAEPCIPLATTERFDFDFHESVELLCEVADRSTKDAKCAIARALCPRGEFENNGVLLQIAPALGVVPKKETFDGFSERIVARIVHRIETLGLEEEPTKTGAGHLAKTMEGKKIVTHDLSVELVAGVIKHWGRLPAKRRNVLCDAMLTNLLNDHETVPNQIAALGLIPLMVPKLSATRQQHLIEGVLSFTEDDRPSPFDTGGLADSNHPLQRFRVNMGSPDDVLGEAIRCLATTEEHCPGTVGDRLAAVLNKHLSHQSGTVRRQTLIALQRNIPRTENILQKALFATRDEDPVAAAAAFHVFTGTPGKRLVSLCPSLTYSLSCATRSQHRILRRSAAKLTGLLYRMFSCDYPPLAELAERIQSDRCWSVRHAFVAGFKPNEKIEADG